MDVNSSVLLITNYILIIRDVELLENLGYMMFECFKFNIIHFQ